MDAYVILESGNASDMTRRVCELIKDGYRVAGGVQVFNAGGFPRFFQAMTFGYTEVHIAGSDVPFTHG